MRFAPVVLLLVACEEFVSVPDVQQSAHSCPGGRVDDLHRDLDGTLWLGCGEAAEGTGLHRSTDGGSTWAEVEGFESFRVSDISQVREGELYVAGTEVGGPHRVRTYDGSTVEPVLVATNQIWNTFHVGTFVRQDDGLAIAESLTGSGMAMRISDGALWEDASPWAEGSHQMLDALDVDGVILGAGSTIIQPPTIFVQTTGAFFDAIPLDETFTGELWSIDHDAGRTAAGGVDQDADVGVIFVNDGDPSDPTGWIPIRIETGQATWVRDVCVHGDRIVAVGSYTVTEEGLAYESTDGGVSFAELTLPDETPSLWSCWLDGDGLWMAGANGFFAAR